MTIDLAALNELDCFYLWAQASVGYADPNANKLGHLRVLAKSFAPTIANLEDMNSLACLRSIVPGATAIDDKPTGDMNELDCLRMIYELGYSSPPETNVASMNALACLRGIVSTL